MSDILHNNIYLEEIRRILHYEKKDCYKLPQHTIYSP